MSLTRTTASKAMRMTSDAESVIDTSGAVPRRDSLREQRGAMLARLSLRMA